MKKMAILIACCLCLLATWAAWAEDNGAEIEQFKIKLTKIKDGVKKMSTGSQEMADLKDQMAEEADTNKQMKLVTQYLERRLDIIKGAMAVRDGLNEAIVEGKDMKMVPDRPDVAQVLNTYTAELTGVIEDMKTLNFEAQELFPGEGAEDNPLLQAGKETQEALSEVIEQLNVTGWLSEDGQVDTKEFFENLQKLRYAVGLHIATSKIDYRMHEQYLKSAKLKTKYAELLGNAFGGMSLDVYLLEGVGGADELAGQAAQLGNMLDQIKLPSLDLLKDSAKRKKFLKDLKDRPKNYKVGNQSYFYHRGKDRYYFFKKGVSGRIWAPYDYKKLTGRYVKLNADDGNWYSHHPDYGDEPVRVYPDDELGNKEEQQE